MHILSSLQSGGGWIVADLGGLLSGGDRQTVTQHVLIDIESVMSSQQLVELRPILACVVVSKSHLVRLV